MRQVSTRASPHPSAAGPTASNIAIPFVRVAIIGGGMGGLTAARVLQRAEEFGGGGGSGGGSGSGEGGGNVVVFEREEADGGRTQGGALDMHPESGQWALAAAGLEEGFRAIARAEGQDMRILDEHGTALWEEVSPPDLMERPEVDRPALRRLLLATLAPGTVRWGHRLVGITPGTADDGNTRHHVLRFANGASCVAGLVVGADGARSSVRPLVTPDLPAHCGVNFIEIWVSDADREHPEVAKTVGRGSLFALGGGKGVIAQRNGDGRIRIYIALRMETSGGGQDDLLRDFATLGITFGGAPDVTRAAILAQFAGWGPEVTRLIAACDDDTFIPRAVNAMPIGARWGSQPGITLLGDAAHQMSPFAGAGANLAMQDGAALALALIADPTDPAAAVAAYEADMFARAEAAARESAEGLEMCMAHDGAARMAAMMQGVHQQG